MLRVFILLALMPSNLAAPAVLKEFYSASLGVWPDTPFTVSGRDILSASGKKITFAGVNWPGAADTMLPEGLQYNSMANISSMIKSLGMNVVRLTYAIEMIDDHFANSPSQSLENTLIQALGKTNGVKVLDQILTHNPTLKPTTTRLEVFDAVADALAAEQIWTHLDNHVSKAQWCCSSNDGNTWFGDAHFDPVKWQRGLGFMAARAKAWKGLTSMALRNELRQSSSSNTQPYTWNVWMDNVIPAANTIHDQNPEPLIFFSGFGYDSDDTYPIQRQTWNGVTFTPESYSFRDKIVYEVHNYQNGASNCDQMQPGLYYNAYCAMNIQDTSCPNHGPVILSEFGYNQEDGSNSGAYAQCLKSILLSQPGYPGGWMQWVLAGSYYIRSGNQDYEEYWGLMKHDWSSWRNETVVREYVLPFVRETLRL